MRIETWLNFFYPKILKDFGFKRELDELSAKLLHDVAKDRLLDCSVLERRIKGKDVAVVGGAYGGERFECDIVITAGKAVMKYDGVPDIHVTDLEEPDDLILKLEREGCILVIHAHGDNLDRIRSVVPKLKAFVGTTQSRPFGRVYNFCGFTDGDRAALIAKRFGAKTVKLVGFDFERASGVKLRKLMWAKRILEHEGLIR